MIEASRQEQHREIGSNITLEQWYSSPEKRLVESKVAEKINKFPESQIRNILLERVAIGKRIRPFLFFLMNSGKGDAEMIGSISAAIELVHQSSLIFDDTIDEHSVREGNRKSIHNLFGNRIESAGIADHLAEYLFSLYEQSIDELDLSDTKKLQIKARSAEMKQQMVIAQLADKLVLKKPSQMKWTEWCFSHSYPKTSELMAFPFIITGIIQDFTPEQQKQMKECGEALGKIYQMYDDLQDLRVAIQVGLLSLSYSLAVLLDNPQELDADSYAILEKITREREILPSDVEKVNKIFSSKADYIANAVEQEIKKLATLISLPIGVSGKAEIEKIVRLANQGSYWEYQVPTSKQ